MKIAVVGNATQFTKDLTAFHGAHIVKRTTKDKEGNETVVSATAHLKIAGAAHIVHEGDWVVEFSHTQKEIWSDQKFRKLAHPVPDSVDLEADAQPTTDAPASEAPASEAPASEAPASETPASETPASETPASETPASE